VADFTFRIRFRLPKGAALGVDTPSWKLATPVTPTTITLKSREDQKCIKDSRNLILVGGGWSSEQEAVCAGHQCKLALALSLARLGGAVDFEECRPHGLIAPVALAMGKQHGGRRVLADEPGLMVFETEPPPSFISAWSGHVVMIRDIATFERVFAFALTHPRELTDAERLSLDLYNASFFEISPHAKFLTLVMAVEALLVPEPRPVAVGVHVEELIRLTETSKTLPQNQIESLCGSLQWLLNESIGQAGRRLARERLAPKTYGGLSAPLFFTHVYSLRSKLVHGKEQQPTLSEVIEEGENLRQFVCDLLTGPLAGFEL
jgi:hypothetical protein